MKTLLENNVYSFPLRRGDGWFNYIKRGDGNHVYGIGFYSGVGTGQVFIYEDFT